MQYINEETNDITLTKGDTLIFDVTLTRGDEPYILQPTDKLRLAVSKGYVGEAGYKLMFTQAIPETLTVVVPAEKTEMLFNGEYKYDIQFTFDDDTVDTVVSANLTITGEAE